jgi:hypothetical protein
MRPPPIKKLQRPPVALVMADVASGRTQTIIGRDTALARNSANHALETPATATVDQPSRFSLHGHSDGSADGIPKQDRNSWQKTEQYTTIALHDKEDRDKPKAQVGKPHASFKVSKSARRPAPRDGLAHMKNEEHEMRIRANIELVERAGLTQLTQAFEKTEGEAAVPKYTMPNMSYW